MTQYLLILAIALQIADAASTIYALRNKLGSEANPVLAKLIDKFGRDRAVVGMKIAGIAALVYWRDEASTQALAWLCAGYALVLANNLRIIVRARKDKA